MIDIQMISGPVIGAVIGYMTNYIAVKMMFRPRKAYYIFGKKIPFTPGIIPKEKDRLAKTIGEAIGGTLLTEDTLRTTLLSEEMLIKIGDEAEAAMEKMQQDETSVRSKLLDYVEEEKLDSQLAKIQNSLTDTLCTRLEELDVGTMIAEQVINSIKTKVEGTIMSMMVRDSFLNPIAEQAAAAIDEYIVTHDEEVIGNMIEEEAGKLLDKPVGELVQTKDDSSFDIRRIVISIYENFVTNKLGSILQKIGIAQIVERKIAEMSVMEVEMLVLEVMKKELNAIVNLGALIGFLLGLFNLFFK